MLNQPCAGSNQKPYSVERLWHVFPSTSWCSGMVYANHASNCVRGSAFEALVWHLGHDCRFLMQTVVFQKGSWEQQQLALHHAMTCENLRRGGKSRIPERQRILFLCIDHYPHALGTWREETLLIMRATTKHLQSRHVSPMSLETS